MTLFGTFLKNKEFISVSQIISYMRGPLLFIFNFHPENCYEGYHVGVEEAGEYQVSDDPMSSWTCHFSRSG